MNPCDCGRIEDLTPGVIYSASDGSKHEHEECLDADGKRIIAPGE